MKKVIRNMTQAEYAYEIISKQILEGKIKPGEPLNEIELSKLTNTSRTPVREAIGRLAYEKLVKVIPHRGAFVTKFNLEDIREIYQLREAVEGMAARLACNHIEIEKLEEIEQKCELLLNTSNIINHNTEHFEINNELHSYILEKSGNTIFPSIVKQFQTVLQMEMEITAKLNSSIAESCDEHRKIIKALKERDPDTAEQEMRKHIAEVYDWIVQALKKGIYI